MKKISFKLLQLIILTIAILMLFQIAVLAHSGKTDKNGGHKDTNNVSGLGSYHYHCGGHEAHLHSNGVCHYESTSKSNNSNTIESNSTKSNSSSSKQSSYNSTSSINNSNSSLNNDSNSKSTSSSSNNKTSSKATMTSESSQTYTFNKNTPIEKNINEDKEVEINLVQIKNKEKNTLNIGEMLTLEAIVQPEEANSTITWISSDTNIAIVDSDGKVNSIAEGKVKITVRSNNGKEDSIDLEIKKAIVEVTEIKLDKDNISLNEGDDIKITETVYPLDATDKTVSWESSDENIATVENGNVSAIKEGNVTIIATSNNQVKGTCNIIIKKTENNIENTETAEYVESSDNLGVGILLGMVALFVLTIVIIGAGGASVYIVLKDKRKR